MICWEPLLNCYKYIFDYLLSSKKVSEYYDCTILIFITYSVI